MRLVYARRALRDIDEILSYIAARSPQGARNVSLAIEHTIELCALNPYASVKTDEPRVYRHPLSGYQYTIFYRIDASGDVIEIVRVVRDARIKDLGRMPDD